MKVWHFTPQSRLERIMQEGLRPNIKDGRGATNTAGIYVVLPGDDRSHFVSMLYGEPAVCLEFDVEASHLESGDDDEIDRPEWAVPYRILPPELTVVDLNEMTTIPDPGDPEYMIDVPAWTVR